MTGPKTMGAWIGVIFFGCAGLLLLAGNIGCVVELVRTGQFSVGESADAPATFHSGTGAVACLGLGFLLAATCFGGSVACLRGRKQ